MIKRIILILLFSFNIYGLDSIDSIDIYTVDKTRAEDLFIYVDEVALKFDNLKYRLRERKINPFNKSSGEIFLDNLEEENSQEMIFGINNRNIYNYDKKYNKNITTLYFDKLFNNNGNSINSGIYSSYGLTKRNNILHSILAGLDLNAQFTDYNINIKTLNEYHYDFTKEGYKSNNIFGGINLGYKQNIGDLFYLEPSLSFIYKYGINNKIRFSSTDVDIKNSFLYSLSPNLRLGLDYRKEDNLYKFYLDLGLDKKIKSKELLEFQFRDQVRNSEINIPKDVSFDFDLGLEFLINNKHRIYIDGGIDFSKKFNTVKASLGYDFRKNND